MNSGVTEETGETARSIVKALGDSPLTLASVVFNVIFVIVIFFSVRDERGRQEAFQTKLFEQQNKTMDMLYNCVPHERPSIDH